MDTQPKIIQSTFHSIPRQAQRLEERHASEAIEVERCGMKIIVDTGVFQTDGDSELMAESVTINRDENFLEIGCGTGIVSLVVAKKAAKGIGVDINERAVECSKRNAKAHDITNIEFFVSDVFESVTDTFDVIICNPPYTSHEVSDDIDRMFWDPDNEMKEKFFSDVNKYLKPSGRVYFGWANFADIDVNLPLRLAKENGFELVNMFEKLKTGNEFIFYVFEFEKSSL